MSPRQKVAMYLESRPTLRRVATFAYGFVVSVPALGAVVGWWRYGVLEWLCTGVLLWGGTLFRNMRDQLPEKYERGG